MPKPKSITEKSVGYYDSLEYIQDLHWSASRLPSLSGNCDFIIGSLQNHIDELKKLAAEMKEKGNEKEWEVAWQARGLEISLNIFKECYEEHGWKPHDQR